LMKALSVFSGGLDSMLAAVLVRAQGVEVQALFFETPFFGSARARKSAASINLPLKVVDITERHLEVVKHPRHGYGSRMNPCIDCHALMFRMAGELMEAEGASFVISGEVLGQRPMSQNKKALETVARECGLEGILLRPLSALRLKPTLPEERGWVDRERLMGFQGRNRKPQMALAEEMGITDYPSPAGGCLLTEEAFSRRLRDLFTARPDPEIREIELLKVGRHFRLSPECKLVVGRNKRENEKIRELSGGGDLLLKPARVPGPTALLQGKPGPDCVLAAATLTAAYSDAADGGSADILIRGETGEEATQVSVPQKGVFKKFLI